MKKTYIPVVLSLVLAFGILIGFLVSARTALSRLSSLSPGAGADLMAGYEKLRVEKDFRVNEILNIIDHLYVDTIDAARLDETVIQTLLSQLDPHSSFIPARDLEKANEQLNGSFSGIGVQFNIQQDTIYVVNVIPNGPSERAGILAGDRVVEVDDSLFVGKGVTNESVFQRLRGEKGTNIRLGVVRRGTEEMLRFTITRDDIPVNSVDVAYMVTSDIGLISVNSFGQNTYSEFLTGLAGLRRQGMKKLIVDLRGNSGGYLDAAVNMINELLVRGSMIVYIEGRNYPRAESFASGTGSFKTEPLVVLIDEFSGSASEIFAGAVQDNDRGKIIGRRSFGKGLVQQSFPLSDGSQARITIARYYTPSGRCIQKPYERGKVDDYESDIWNRFLHGEFYSADSIHQNDSVEYLTVGGRPVYGGGGIMPDIFVPRDTAGTTKFFASCVNKNLPYRFAIRFTDARRGEMRGYTDWRALDGYLDGQPLLDDFYAFAASEGVTGSARDKKNSALFLRRHIHSYIIRNMLDNAGFYPYINSFDTTVLRAVSELER